MNIDNLYKTIKHIEQYIKGNCYSNTCRGRRGHDCMVVIFTTTYAIIACHH